MRGEGGQATVEWVALVLAAALVMGAAAALAGREDERGLGRVLASRIAGAPDPITGRPPPTSVPAPPPTRTAGAVQAFRRLRGIADVAKHTWIVCLGYKRWRYELENPMAPNEALPLSQAFDIVNGCLNPYDYLLED